MERNNIQHQKKENQPPSDLVDVNNPIGDASVAEKITKLFDYFNQKEGDSSIIKNWVSNFHLHSLLSFCDVLSTILQLAGKRIEITVEHIESDAFDIVLEEFQESTECIKTRKTFKNSAISKKDQFQNIDSENDDEQSEDEKQGSTADEENDESEEGNSSSQVPPLTEFLKDKNLSKTLTKFWHELSEGMISCNALYNNTFKNFRQWLVAFNKSKIRIVRQSSSLCALSLFNTLVISLNRSKNELFKLSNLFDENEENKQNAMLIQSKNLYEQEVKFYTSISLFFLQNIVYLRITNDPDESIRMMSVQSLTDAAIDCPSEFADFQKLKCLEKIFNDRSSRNRRDVLRCIQRILNESPLNKNSIKSDSTETSLYYYDKIKPLAIKFIPIILNLLNDRDNSVVASAIDCLYSFAENNLLGHDKKIEELCVKSASSLLSDESQIIRAAAAKFFARLLFYKPNNNSEMESNASIIRLVDFLVKNFCSSKSKNSDNNSNNENDLQIVISSLFQNLPFLHDWDEIIDILSIERDNDRARILAKVLFYSAEKLNNSGNYQSSSGDYNNQIRKLSLSLVKSLPILIKGYQNDDDIVLPLVDAAKFINLDVVSENSYEHYFQKLLAEICNIFLHSSNRIVFTTSIASLYELSVRQHQLSLIARRELDRLAVECGNDCDLSEYFNDTKDQSSESLIKAIKDVVEDRESIAKFVAASRLVDVSDNGKLREIVINRINILSKVFEQNEIEFDIDPEFHDIILEVIADCIECLQFVFRWDIKHIHNKKLQKDEYRQTFFSNLDIFYRFLTTTMIASSIENEPKSEDKEDEKSAGNEEEDTENLSQNTKENKVNAASLVKEQAFKALSDVIALSPFLKKDVNDVLIEVGIIENFYTSYHNQFRRSKKAELFSYAMHPVRTRAIELSYASHLFVYFGFAPLQQPVKNLWKEISQGLKVSIRGTHLLSAMILASSSLNKNEMRLSARFMLGKVKAADFIEQFLRFEFERQQNKEKLIDVDDDISSDQYESIVAASLPFFFGITKDKAKDFLEGTQNEEPNVPSKYTEVLSLIANGEKPTQKAFSKIIQASKSNQNRVLQASNAKAKAASKTKLNNNSDKSGKDLKKKMNEIENDDDDDESSSSSTSSSDSNTGSGSNTDNDDIESE